MAQSQVQGIELDNDDVAILLELLDRELGELPSERRHSATANMRDELRERSQRLTELRDRLRRRLAA